MSARATLAAPGWRNDTPRDRYPSVMTTASIRSSVPLLADPPAHGVLQAVGECTSDLASIRDRTVILRGIVRRTRMLIGADMCYLSLNDLAAAETFIHITEGVTTEAYQNIRMPLGTGVLGAVAAGGIAVQTADYLVQAEMNHLPAIDEIVRAEGVKAILGAPLRVGGQMIGALLVAHRVETTFSPATIAALEQMAAQTAIALEQTRLAEEIVHLQRQVANAETVTTRRHRELEDVLRFDEQLLGALIASAGPAGVLDLLRQATARPVGLYDPMGRLRSGDAVVTDAVLRSRPIRSAVEASAVGGGAIAVTGARGALILAAASAGEEHLGTLVMPGIDQPVPAAMLVRASVFVSAMLLLERTISDADNREQSALIDDLLHARPGDQHGVRARMLAYGVNPSGTITVFVTGVAASERYLTISAVRDALGLSSSLVALHAGHVCAITATDDAEKLAARIVQLSTSRSVAALVGYSVSQQGLAGLAGAHEEAHRVISAQKALGWPSGHADAIRLGLAGIVLSGVEADHVNAVIDRLLGPLLGYDRRNDSRLTETAWAYLENGTRLAPTAEQLHVHRNTVRQRAERIDGILGAGWRRPMTSVDVHFALRLWRLRERA